MESRVADETWGRGRRRGRRQLSPPPQRKIDPRTLAQVTFESDFEGQFEGYRLHNQI